MSRRRFRDTSIAAQLLDLPPSAGVVIGVVVWLAIAVGLRLAGPPWRAGADLDGGLVGGAIIVASLTGLVTHGRRLVILERATSVEQLKAGTSIAFEELCIELYRLKGYNVTENGLPLGPDGGVDFEVHMRAGKYLAQCKHWWSQEVGVQVVRELWGIVYSEGAAGGIVLTSSTFNSAALDFQKGKRNLILLDGSDLLLELRKVQLGVRGRSLRADWIQAFSAEFSDAIRSLPAPACPQCGTPMQLVTIARSLTITDRFWGCSQYPECKGYRRLRPILDDAVARGGRRAPAKVSLRAAIVAGLAGSPHVPRSGSEEPTVRDK